MRKRLEPSVFRLPIHDIRHGFFSAVYFWRTKRVLEQDNRHPTITHQIFQKKENVIICGTDEAIAILKTGTGYYKDYSAAAEAFEQLAQLRQQADAALRARDYHAHKKLCAKCADLSRKLDELWVDCFDRIQVWSLYDGDRLSAWETAMLIEGDYSLFAHLESLYLGVLARRTKIATNTRALAEAARGKPVLYFADRFDYFLAQPGDGHAAQVGGAAGVCTDAMAALWQGRGLGTIPHAMIVAYGGDTALAAEKFNAFLPTVNTISLVDFDNDCVNTALAVARRLGERLWGVRIDTAENLVDRSLQNLAHLPDEEKYGPVPLLAEKVRQALDREGFGHVKIVVSGGLNPEKIARFEERGAPVDAYGVGSWILSGRFDFTADAVRLEGKNLAKVGREYKPNDRLELVRG